MKSTAPGLVLLGSIAWACGDAPSGRSGADGAVSANADAAPGAGPAGDASASAAGGGAGGRRDGGGGADAGGVDADAPRGGHTTTCEGRRFCDDFEGHVVAKPPAAPWKVSLNPSEGLSPSRVVVDATRSRSGTKSVRASAAGGFFTRAFFGLEGGVVSSFADAVMYGRVMVYMPAAAGGLHTTILAANGPVPPTNMPAQYKLGHTLGDRFMVNYAGPSSTCNDCSVVSETVHPSERWACIEWSFDAINSTQRYWLDGVELADARVTLRGGAAAPTSQPWPAPRFQSLDLGWETYVLDFGAAELWFDDVVLDDERIGCPP